jgi:hypothetical protein
MKRNFIDELKVLIKTPNTLDRASNLRRLATDAKHQSIGFESERPFADLSELEELIDFISKNTALLVWPRHEFWETEEKFLALEKLLSDLISDGTITNIEKHRSFADYDAIARRVRGEFMKRYNRQNEDVMGW